MLTPEVHHYKEDKNESRGKSPTEVKQEGSDSASVKKETKSEKSNEIISDSSDAKINIEKLSKFKEKMHSLQELGWPEVQQIINDVMSQFDSDIKEILKKPKEKTKEVKFEDITRKSDKQLEDEVTEILGQIPGKFNKQKAMIKKIYKKWSKDDIEQLNTKIDECMKNFDKRIGELLSSKSRGPINVNKKAD